MFRPKKIFHEKNKGFTLVELLVVIIVISILAGIYMLSTSKTAAKANATRIISDMRSLKSATLLYYAENGKWPSGTEDTKIKMLVDTYLGRNLSFASGKAPYHVWGGVNNVERVFVKCFLTNLPVDSPALREALKKIAAKKDIPLYNNTWNDKYPPYTGGDEIVMPIK